MDNFEPPHQDLRCLQIQLFSSLVLKELTFLQHIGHQKTGPRFKVLSKVHRKENFLLRPNSFLWLQIGFYKTCLCLKNCLLHLEESLIKRPLKTQTRLFRCAGLSKSAARPCFPHFSYKGSWQCRLRSNAANRKLNQAPRILEKGLSGWKGRRIIKYKSLI